MKKYGSKDRISFGKFKDIPLPDNIDFNNGSPGVVISKNLKEKLLKLGYEIPKTFNK